jgi:hypothetical protein
MQNAVTPEERAYIAYSEWCDFLDLTPADLETWRKATKNLSETNYSGLPPRHAKSGRAAGPSHSATRRNANGAADET